MNGGGGRGGGKADVGANPSSSYILVLELTNNALQLSKRMFQSKTIVKKITQPYNAFFVFRSIINESAGMNNIQGNHHIIQRLPDRLNQ